MSREELDARRARGDRLVESIDSGPTIAVLEPIEGSRREADPLGISVARRMREGLSDIYLERLRGVFLYGSRARGDHSPDSDVDILVVLDGIGPYSIELKRTSELASNLSLESGVIVSRTFASEVDWRTGAKPFLVNAREDAVAV